MHDPGENKISAWIKKMDKVNHNSQRSRADHTRAEKVATAARYSILGCWHPNNLCLTGLSST